MANRFNLIFIFKMCVVPHHYNFQQNFFQSIWNGCFLLIASTVFQCYSVSQSHGVYFSLLHIRHREHSTNSFSDLILNRLFLKLHLTLRLPIIRYLFKKYSYVFVFVAPINNTFNKVRYALPVLLWTASFYRVLYHIHLFSTLIYCPFYMKIIPIHSLLLAINQIHSASTINRL